MKVIVTESKLGIEYLADVISSCDQNGIECIVDDNAGDILYYEPKLGKYGTDELLQNSDKSIFDLVKDKERLASVLMDAQGDKFKEFAVQWNDLQKKGAADEVYKTKHCNPIRGNFAESSSGCEYDAGSLTEKVATWYRKAYPSDKEMADEMRPRRSTFQDVIDALESGEDVYEVIGADDSIVRERVFEELSKLTGKDYDYFYDMWLHTNYEESNMRLMGNKFTERARNTRPTTAKDREEFEKFRKRWKSLGKKKNDDEEEDYVDDFGLRVNGIEAQVSEGDESDDWSSSEGEVEIIWDTDEYEDFGIFSGDTPHYVIDYDRVDTHDDLINELCMLIGKEYPDLDFDPSDFVIANEEEFWEQRGGNPGLLDESGSEDNNEVAEALAKQIRVSVNDVSEKSGEYEYYSPDYVFGVKLPDGSDATYLVYDDEESANTSAADDLGEKFQDDYCNLGAAIDYFGFATFSEYINGLDDDELDNLGELAGEMDMEEFAKYIQDNVGVDYRGFAEYNIGELGAAWHLAEYDSKEIGLANGMKAYRVD